MLTTWLARFFRQRAHVPHAHVGEVLAAPVDHRVAPDYLERAGGHVGFVLWDVLGHEDVIPHDVAGDALLFTPLQRVGCGDAL